MDKKKLFLLIAALVVAVGTALLARSMFAGAAAPQVQAAAPVPKGPSVLIAKTALPVGTILTAESVAYQQWPEDLVQDAYFIEGEADMNKLLGTVVRNPITAGEPLTQGTLVAPGDRGFLAAALGPGMRAVTVPVSENTAVAGFVFPGDRVDMMLTQTVNGGGGPSLKAAETILRNVRVLATGQRTTTSTTKDGKTRVRSYRTVTLEVTPRMAEKVAVAQMIGKLSLALRSIADNQAELEKAIASGQVELSDDVDASEEELALQTALARPQDGATTYSTGGDVSRFQRSSISRSEGSAATSGSAGRPPVSAPRPRGPEVRIMRGSRTATVPIANNGQALAEQSEGPDLPADDAPTEAATLN